MNVLVTLLYDLGDSFDLHGQIHALCVESYERHLQDLDRCITLTGEVSKVAGAGRRLQDKAAGYGEMLRDVHARVEDIWRQGHNVLLVDGDTVCVRPTPWPEGDGLRLFNMACARVPYEAFERDHYLHSGVRYLPATMSARLWDVARPLIDRWDDAMWAYDQLVWNAMFWAQPDRDPERAREYVDPRYCYVPLREYDNLGVPRFEAYIVHFASTRGVMRCLTRMRRVVGR